LIIIKIHNHILNKFGPSTKINKALSLSVLKFSISLWKGLLYIHLLYSYIHLLYGCIRFKQARLHTQRFVLQAKALQGRTATVMATTTFMSRLTFLCMFYRIYLFRNFFYYLMANNLWIFHFFAIWTEACKYY